jgi:DNA-binding transcriptional LysR family regulator
MLDAHQLNIFLVAAETLNFTQAAETLHMSQPSVSQHIRALEQHFGEPLFIRKGRSLELSDAGRILIPLAKQFVQQSTCIDETMSSIQGQIQGEVNLGCSSGTAVYLLPGYVGQFQEEYPDVSLVCQTKAAHQLLEALNHGAIHFLLSQQLPDPHPCLSFRPITAEEITLIVPSGHPLFNRRTVPLEPLRQEQFVLPDRDSWLYHHLRGVLGEKGFQLDEVSFSATFDNLEAVVLAVSQGLGIGFCPRVLSTKTKQLAALSIEGLRMEEEIYLGRNIKLPSTSARDAFWSFMTHRLQQPDR